MNFVVIRRAPVITENCNTDASIQSHVSIMLKSVFSCSCVTR